MSFQNPSPEDATVEVPPGAPTVGATPEGDPDPAGDEGITTLAPDGTAGEPPDIPPTDPLEEQPVEEPPVEELVEDPLVEEPVEEPGAGEELRVVEDLPEPVVPEEIDDPFAGTEGSELEVPETFKPVGPGVERTGIADGEGSENFLLDLDGDGLFETFVLGEEQPDGTFATTEVRTLDEPRKPSELADEALPVEETPPGEDVAPDGDLERAEIDLKDDGQADGRLPGEEPPEVEEEAPDGAVHPPPGPHQVAAEVDVPVALFHEAPTFAAGADDHAAAVGGDEAGVEEQPFDTGAAIHVSTPEAGAPGYEPAGSPQLPLDDEPVSALSEEDEDDAGLLERIADAVGDFFTDGDDEGTP